MTPESRREEDIDRIERQRKWSDLVHWNLQRDAMGRRWRENDPDDELLCFVEPDSFDNQRVCDLPPKDRILDYVSVEEKIYGRDGRIHVTISIALPFRNNGMQRPEYTEHWIVIRTHDDYIPDIPYSGKTPVRFPMLEYPKQETRSRLERIMLGQLDRKGVTAIIAAVALLIGTICATKKPGWHGNVAEASATTPTHTSLRSPPEYAIADPRSGPGR